MYVKVEHRLGIQAPADTIWAEVSDIASWGGWNPLYPRAEGQVRMGERLTLEVAVPGRKRRLIRPTVVDWVPREQIHWELSAAGGLLKSTRYIEIEQLIETGCIFANGEIFTGPLTRFLGKRQRDELKAGYKAMGEAVKIRAEAAWRAKEKSPN
ncbi:MAG: SRPBCC family protein [Caulobacteraceae bacterium]